MMMKTDTEKRVEIFNLIKPYVPQDVGNKVISLLVDLGKPEE